jgi:hypothetical protein
MQPVRIREMAQAFFQPQGDRAADIRTDLSRLVKDANGTLRPLAPHEFRFPLFADGRLVRVDDSNGYAVVRYTYPQTGLFAAVPVYLARQEPGRLVWVR